LNEKNPTSSLRRKREINFYDKSCPVIEIIKKPGVRYEEKSKAFRSNYYVEQLTQIKDVVKKVVLAKEED